MQRTISSTSKVSGGTTPRNTSPTKPAHAASTPASEEKQTTDEFHGEPIDQPKPRVNTTSSPEKVQNTPQPRPRSSQVPVDVEDLDTETLNRMLTHWPSPSHGTAAIGTTSLALSQQLVAGTMVQNLSLFEQLPLDALNVVLHMVMGDPERLQKEVGQENVAAMVHADAAALVVQMRTAYGELQLVSKRVYLSTQHLFQQRMLQCSLRFPPEDAKKLLALMTYEPVLRINPEQIRPFTVIACLTQVLGQMHGTDADVCGAALSLGHQLLQIMRQAEITPDMRWALQRAPQLIVRALCVRLGNTEGPAKDIASTLKALVQWASRQSPDVAVPLLLELLFTLDQLDQGGKKGMLADGGS